MKKPVDIAHVLAKMDADGRLARNPAWTDRWIDIGLPRKVERRPLLERCPAFLDVLHERYLQADALALHFRDKTYRTLNWMFGLGFATAVAFECNAHVVPWVLPHELNRAQNVGLSVTLAIYLGLWGLIGLVYLRSQRGRYQEKFRSYRALAEGLRVQFFWLLAGVTDSIGEVFEARDSDEALPVLEVIEHLAARPRREVVDRPEVDVFVATRSGLGVMAQWRTAGRDDMDARQLALTSWIENQEDYFKNAVAREETKRTRWKCAEQWSFVLALLIPLVLMVLHFFSPFLLMALRVAPDELGPEGGLRIAMIVGSGLAMVAAGLIHGYVEKRAFGEHIESYGEILATLDHYRYVLSRDGSDDARNDLREFGKMALRENGDWVRLHRWRPLEPPRG